MSLHLCRFSDAGVKADPRAEAAGVRKAPRHEVAVGGALAGSERYGDLTLAPRSIVRATPARGDVGVECGGYLGGRAECINGQLANTARGRKAATRIAECFHNFCVLA